LRREGGNHSRKWGEGDLRWGKLFNIGGGGGGEEMSRYPPSPGGNAGGKGGGGWRFASIVKSGAGWEGGDYLSNANSSNRGTKKRKRSKKGIGDCRRENEGGGGGGETYLFFRCSPVGKEGRKGSDNPGCRGGQS